MGGILYLVINKRKFPPHMLHELLQYIVMWIYMTLRGMWFVVGFVWLHVVLVVVLNANFIHFYQLHPYPSPPSWKILSVQKTPENSTLWAYHLILPTFVGFPTSLHLSTKIDWSEIEKSISQNRYITHVIHYIYRIFW